MAQAVTLLWFGNSAYVADGEAVSPIPLPEKGDPAAAIAAFCANLDPKPSTAHLIYQPSGLNPVGVQCVRSNRSVLQKTLGTTNPSITSPTTTWSVLHPLPFEAAYSSMLFVEPKNRIPRLAAALLESNIELLGAWPIPALADQLPELRTDDATGVVCVTTDNAAVVYARQHEATRRFVILSNIASRATYPAEVNQAFAAFDQESPPPLLIFHLGEPWDLGKDANPNANPVYAPITELFAHTAQLKLRSPANFNPPGSNIPWRLFLNVASSFALLAALILAAQYGLDWRELQTDARRRAAQAEILRNQIQVLANNRDAIVQNRAFAAEINSDSSGIAALLETMIAETPVEITIHSLTTTESSFTLRGTVHAEATAANGPYARFLTGISRSDLPWTLSTDTPKTLKADTFTITGRFHR